jgi:hypothetical protein
MGGRKLYVQCIALWASGVQIGWHEERLRMWVLGGCTWHDVQRWIEENIVCIGGGGVPEEGGQDAID